MKKIYLLHVMCLLAIVTVDAQYVTLYTPKGSSIETFIRDEYTNEEIHQITEQYKASYGSENVLAPASRKYNCHSYAWNLSEGGSQKVWMNQYDRFNNPNIRKYWEDGSYVETTASEGEKIFYYNGDHSAIKSKTIAGKYESKWGKAPLMRHNPTEGPSIYNMTYRKYYKKTPPPPYISGPTTVCDQATYTIQNLPSGARVEWSASSNMVILSGQGSSSVRVSKSATANYGAGNISASISLNNNNIGTVSRYIDYVGTPVAQSISGPSSLYVGATGSYTAEPSIAGNGIQYRWYVNPSGASSSPWNNTNSITFYQEGTYDISCQIISSCGYGSAATMVVTVGRSRGFSFTLFSNPAGDVVTLRLMETDRDSGESILSTARSVYEIQLWSGMTMLRSYKTNEPTFQIPVAGLPAGLYFVRVVKDGEVHTEKLIKN